jgi:hemin uptake protein HemP
MESTTEPKLQKPLLSIAVTRKVGAAVARPPSTRSELLFGAQREITIEHAGSLYRLRITQNTKLILTK